jgi:EPS-associated MarR family transcriptional regulator
MQRMTRASTTLSPAQEEAQLKVLRALDAEPSISQRDLAQQLGISLGKTNYCLHALLEKGWIKAKNFKNHKNKIGYTYLLTPKGIEQKSKLIVSFLKRKQNEFEALKEEIEHLSKEVKEGAD